MYTTRKLPHSLPLNTVRIFFSPSFVPFPALPPSSFPFSVFLMDLDVLFYIEPSIIQASGSDRTIEPLNLPGKGSLLES